MFIFMMRKERSWTIKEKNEVFLVLVINLRPIMYIIGTLRKL